MTAILQCRKEQNVMDQILHKIRYEDWESVLRLCELASQVKNLSPINRITVLDSQMRALLKMGHFDSMLKQINGMTESKGSEDKLDKEHEHLLLAYAVNASWQLGRWDTLNHLVGKLQNKNISGMHPDQEYSFALGKAMLRLNNRQHNELPQVLKEARHAIIPPLSVVANEDYHRALPYIVRLQCLREIEDINIALLENSSTSDILGGTFKKDSHLSSFDGTIDFDLLSARLAMARIISDKELEASLWLHAGVKARKEGMFHISENSLAHADALYDYLKINANECSQISTNINAGEAKFQQAKLKHANGHSTEALQMIKVQDFEMLLNNNEQDRDLTDLRRKLEKNNGMMSFARNALQATEWMIQSGLQSGSEVIERYKLLCTLTPSWERGKCFEIILELYW